MSISVQADRLNQILRGLQDAQQRFQALPERPDTYPAISEAMELLSIYTYRLLRASGPDRQWDTDLDRRQPQPYKRTDGKTYEYTEAELAYQRETFCNVRPFDYSRAGRLHDKRRRCPK